MLTYLWTHRERPSLLTRAWLLAWAKRLQQMPNLVRQWRHHRSLAHRGAKIHPMTFFSDSNQASGRLEWLTVGEGTFVGRVELSVHAPLSVGEQVCINDGAKILTASHAIDDPAWSPVSKPITIEDHAWIATNAIILPGVTVGRGAVVGAGAVVSRSVLPGAVVVGNPARALERRRTDELAYSPLTSLALFGAWLGRPTPARTDT